MKIAYSLITLILLITNCVTALPRRNVASDTIESRFSNLAPGGRMSLHGMVIIGSGPYFLSHIPMLHEPHDFQIFAEVVLKDKSGTPIVTDFSSESFTLKPIENFSLNDYLAGRLKKFSASIHTGAFEQGGKIIPGLETVKVQVVKLIHARQLPAESSEQWLEVSDQKHVFQESVITPENNIQRIKNKTTEKSLWCVVGPDFFEPCN
jgi:hypothetical protein